MKLQQLLFLFVWIMLSGFNLPNEKKYLSSQAANIEVFDAAGNHCKLYTLLNKKPLIISPVYTKCYSLCGLISNGVQNTIMGLGTLGKDFNVVSFSFDSSDTQNDLANYQLRWNMDGKSWKTISASPQNINAFMTSLDFQYDYNPTSKEYNHPAILIVLTPSGKISRYVYGVNPSKRDIKLSVIEANAEKTRPGIIEGFYLRCFGYDPVSKTYKTDWGFIISTSAGLLIICIVSGIFIRSFIVTKKEG